MLGGNEFLAGEKEREMFSSIKNELRFAELVKELNLPLDRGAIAWIKCEYDSYYKGDYEDETGSAFEYIRNLILKGE